MKKIANVGIMDLKGGSKHILYDRWVNMLKRCYDKNNKSYKTYGQKGITVCNSWHMFSNYVRDIEQKENYDKLCENPKNWELDKDVSMYDSKCYSNDTVSIITKKSNIKERNNRNGLPGNYTRKSIIQLNLDGTFVNEYVSASDASRKTGIDRSSICLCCRGQYKNSGGYIWKYK